MALFKKLKTITPALEEDLNDAKLSTADFADINIKKRAFFNVLGARLAIKTFFNNKIKADNLYSMYTIHNVLEEVDVADVYFEGIKIDVRLVFNKDEIFIPKSHFQYEILPDIYTVFIMDETLSAAEFLGFFKPEDIDQVNQNRDYFFLEPEKLQSPEGFKNYLETFSKGEDSSFMQIEEEKLEEMFISLVDKNLDIKDKKEFLRNVASNILYRETLVEYENFEIISKEAIKSGVFAQDSFLNVVGAQELFEDENFDESQLEIIDFKNNDDEQEEKGLSFYEDEDDDSKPSSGSGEAGLNVAAAGLGLGAAIVAGSAAAAAAGTNAQAGLVAGTADVLSTGIEAGADVLSSVLNSTQPALDKDTSVENFDELFKESPEEVKEEISSEEEDFDVTANSDSTIEEIPEVNFDESFEELVFDELEDEKDEDVIKIEAEVEEQEAEIESIEVNDEIEEIQVETPIEIEDETISEVDDFLEQMATDSESEIKEQEAETMVLPELGELPDLEELPDPGYLSDLGSEGFETEAHVENVNSEFSNLDLKLEEENPPTIEELNLSTNDALFIDEEIPPMEESIMTDDDGFELKPLEDIAEEETLLSFDNLEGKKEVQEEVESSRLGEDELEAKIKEIEAAEAEEDEDFATTVEEKAVELVADTAQSDDFILEVDDFLKDIETIDTEGNPISGALNIDDAILSDVLGQNEDLLAKRENSIADGSKDGDVLQVLFNEEQKQELLDENYEMENNQSIDTPEKIKRKKMIIAASAASIVLASAIIVSGVMHNGQPANSPQNMAQAPISADGQMTSQSEETLAGENTQSDLQGGQTFSSPQAIPGENQQNVSPDMGRAVSNAFMSEPVNANISKVAWEVPEDLAYNDSFRKYLQMAGKNIKLNLQNSLLLATEMAYSNKVVVDLEIGKDGGLTNSNVVASSGSKQIDKIVLQSVKETLMYLKVPSSELNGKNASATLIINF